MFPFREQTRRCPMPRSQNEPLRPLSSEERTILIAIARAGSERADRVARAKALLAAAGGASFAEAARQAGRRSGPGVGRLVARFNRTGLAALDGPDRSGWPAHPVWACRAGAHPAGVSPRTRPRTGRHRPDPIGA